MKGTIQIALKRIPGGIKSKSSEEEEAATYLGMNGKEWEIENSAKGSSSYYNFAC